MSRKTGHFFILVLLASFAFAARGFADGNRNNYLYLQANVGYVEQQWKSTFGNFNYADSPARTNWHNGNGGFAYGFNVGYHAFKHLGFEAGYFGFAHARLTTNNKAAYGFSQANFHTNDVYLAMRALLPITECFQVFTKVGVHAKFVTGSRGEFNSAWRYHEPTAVRPMLGAGLQYMVYKSVGLNLQYLFLSDKIKNTNAIQDSSTDVNPNAHVVTFGLVYNIYLE